ncbi:hypothetical protein NA8A_20167 [Nitratireductor indicus C115]|uniref:Uncharacterized protein n=1 Tax=Nitratireductor indicus C115 TaxID=1231190 RepID=K2NZH0_9HYPH|nr:hypothetical protein [Nitratireductor indicus]EKF40476.1 hypothetical protein NA8A_20167 [Nitratireductor indicus C115]SFQ50183.1 hypothetical protein SAMN05216176_104361 [Nitratireductor indicus]
MLRDASEDMAVRLKDTLRGMRDFLRAHRHDIQVPPGRALSEAETLLGRAVSMVDDTLTMAESVSRGVLPARGDGRVLLPLTNYFAHDPVAGEHVFRRHMYKAAKAAAAGIDAEDIPAIRESFFTRAHETLRRKQGHILAGPAGSASGARLASLVATLLQDICRQALAEEGTPPTADSAAICMRCFAPALIAAALLGPDEGLSEEELLETAALAVSARAERMAQSLRADRSVADLAAIVESMLTHLP